MENPLNGYVCLVKQVHIMNAVQLKAHARERGNHSYSRLRKQELINYITPAISRQQNLLDLTAPEICAKPLQPRSCV